MQMSLILIMLPPLNEYLTGALEEVPYRNKLDPTKLRCVKENNIYSGFQVGAPASCGQG
jgi:hypothetical protein